MTRDRVGYQTIYLWTCRCGQVWLRDRRPREGVTLACEPGPRQTPLNDRVVCLRRYESTGKREGRPPAL